MVMMKNINYNQNVYENKGNMIDREMKRRSRTQKCRQKLF